MSEIRDRVKTQITAIVTGTARLKCAEQVLSIPELAIVDRKAELPDNPHSESHYSFGGGSKFRHGNNPLHLAYKHAQQDMLKAGFVKEIKD